MFARGEGFGIAVARRRTDKRQIGKKWYRSQADAKAAALNALIWAKTHLKSVYSSANSSQRSSQHLNYAAIIAANCEINKSMPTNADRRQLLLSLVPDGLPVMKQWLQKQNPDLDRHAVDNLLKSKQLVALAPASICDRVHTSPGKVLSAHCRTSFAPI